MRQRFATQRIYGFRGGRRVLLAAPGDPIPHSAEEPKDVRGPIKGGDAPKVDTVDITGSIAEVQAWVGDDVQRALRVLEVEKARPSPRVTLVRKLEAIAG